jgi:hypothetical protein
MRIGLIQTRGIGDIVIAAPIAQHFVDQGHDVFWPVDLRFLPPAQAAFPEIRFLAVDQQTTGDGTLEYFYTGPLAQLNQHGCEQVFSLYSYLSGLDIVNQKLAHSLKFDEYKYAVTGVPFQRKWQLRVQRDRQREQALFDKLDIRGSYVLLHEHGSNFRLQIALPPDVLAAHQVVRISEISDNPFDWLTVMERAYMFACVDSCFANLAEQLALCERKYLFLRSDKGFTPVFKNNWQFR